MNRLLLTLISLLVSAMMASADNWCEALINQLNTNAKVDKTVTVNREPDTHALVNAIYDYKFKSDDLYTKIWETLRKHAGEAEYFTQKDYKDYKTILMRVTIDGQRWDCKLQPGASLKQFIVTVNGNSKKLKSIKRDIGKNIKRQKSAQRYGTKKVIKENQSQAAKTQIEQNNKELEKAALERKKLRDR